MSPRTSPAAATAFGPAAAWVVTIRRHAAGILRWAQAIVWSAIVAGCAHAADGVPSVEWVSPPAWLQSDSQSVALRPGMRIAEGDTIVTGAGGSASIHVDSDRRMLILQRSVWTWSGDVDGGSGDIQQGEVHMRKPVPASAEDAGAGFRLYADGHWRLVLFSASARAPADALAGHLAQNGYPADLIAAESSGTARSYQVAVAGFRSMEETSNAGRNLAGRFPGVSSPTVERIAVKGAQTAPPPRAPAAVSRPPDPPTAGNCAEWGAFAPADAARARAALARLPFRPQIVERRAEPSPLWWVYIAPKANRKAALAKANELKSLGISDYSVVHEPAELRFAISLGVFSSEAGARSRLAQLKTQGVRTATIAPHGMPQAKLLLQLRDFPEQAFAQIAGLPGDFPGTQVKGCSP